MFQAADLWPSDMESFSYLAVPEAKISPCNGQERYSTGFFELGFWIGSGGEAHLVALPRRWTLPALKMSPCKGQVGYSSGFSTQGLG